MRDDSNGWLAMLDRCTSYLMAVAVLLHSILGCCWHHAHSAGDPAGQVDCRHGQHGAPNQLESDMECGLDANQTHADDHGHPLPLSSGNAAPPVVRHRPSVVATIGADECWAHWPCESPESQCEQADCRYVRPAKSISLRPDSRGVATRIPGPAWSFAALRSQLDRGGTGSFCANLCAPPQTQVWRL